MLSFHMVAPSLALASAQYCRALQLKKQSISVKGVRCTVNQNHDVGRFTTYSLSSLENGATRRGNEASRGLEVDDLVYKERFIVRISHIGVNKTATIETIASFLQDTSCNRAQRFGWTTDRFPAPPSMRKHRLVWVISRAHIEMYNYPTWGDVLEIEHWTEVDRNIALRFDFIIRNLSTDEVIGRSTSKCLTMNQDTRKLHKISDELREECLALCPKSPRSAFSEKNNPSLRKINKLDEPAYYQLGLMPRRADLDMNKHVNNVTYYSWLLQSIPRDVVEAYELESIAIEFRRECQYSDCIDSLASTEVKVIPTNTFQDEFTSSNLNLNSGVRLQFIHLLKFSGTDREINLGRTVWRKLDK